MRADLQATRATRSVLGSSWTVPGILASHRAARCSSVSRSADGSDVWAALDYRCARSLDKDLSRRFKSVIVIPRPEVNEKQGLHGQFLLFTPELFSENELARIFGYPPRSSRIAAYSKGPATGQFLAIYDFIKHSMHQQDSSDLIDSTEPRL